MEKQLILLDTSLLIDYFRKTNKENSYFSKLANDPGKTFAVSAITEFEILLGATEGQKDFWKDVFADLIILDFNSDCAQKAVQIQRHLKRKSQMIDIPDLFIAATAIQHNLQVATLNFRHFERIENLQVIQEL